MTEEQLRALVREIVEERLTGRAPAAEPAREGARPGRHASHQLLHVLPGADAGGPCLIEPAVRCNLCGYCQSLGH